MTMTPTSPALPPPPHRSPPRSKPALRAVPSPSHPPTTRTKRRPPTTPHRPPHRSRSGRQRPGVAATRRPRGERGRPRRGGPEPRGRGRGRERDCGLARAKNSRRGAMGLSPVPALAIPPPSLTSPDRGRGPRHQGAFRERRDGGYGHRHEAGTGRAGPGPPPGCEPEGWRGRTTIAARGVEQRHGSSLRRRAVVPRRRRHGRTRLRGRRVGAGPVVAPQSSRVAKIRPRVGAQYTWIGVGGSGRQVLQLGRPRGAPRRPP